MMVDGHAHSTDAVEPTGRPRGASWSKQLTKVDCPAQSTAHRVKRRLQQKNALTDTTCLDLLILVTLMRAFAEQAPKPFPKDTMKMRH